MASIAGAAYPADFNAAKAPADLPRQFGCFIQSQNGQFLGVRGPETGAEGTLFGGREKQAWELRFVDAATVNVLNCGRNAWMSAEKFLLQKGEVSARCPFALCGAPERWSLVFLPDQGPNHFGLRSAYGYFLSIDEQNSVRAHERSHIPEKPGRCCVFRFAPAPPPNPEALVPLTNLSLCVQVVEGRGLAAADSNGFSDPYCILKWGSKTQKTKAIDKTLNPVWNETFDLGGATKEEASEVRTQVEVTVWDKDTLKDDFLGTFFVDLEDLELARRTTVDKWYRLAKRKASDSVSGDIHLRIWFKDAFAQRTPQKASISSATPPHITPPSTPRSPGDASVKPAEITDGLGIYVRNAQLGTYQIKAATLERIIEELTQDTGRMHDRDFVDLFLLTFRAFTTPTDFLNRIIYAYDEGTPPQLAISRPRICVLLHRWIDNFWNDFSEPPEGPQRRAQLEAFVVNRVAATLAASAESLKQLIGKRERKRELRRGGTRTKLFRASEVIPRPTLTPQQWNPERLHEMSALEVARQLTLIEHELLCSIEMWEFMQQAWLSKTRERDAPHIIACIQRFNDVGQWVASAILRAPADLRVSLTDFFVRLAAECFTLHNFCGTLQVLSGLQTMPVLRLKDLWNELPVKTKKTFDELSALFLPESNWRQARELVQAVTGPCIPYLGIILTDLVMLDQGSPDYVDNTRMINVDKLRIFTRIIKTVRMLQLTRYTLEPLPFVRDYLLAVRAQVMPEDEMWESSYSILPKASSRRNINLLAHAPPPAAPHAQPVPLSKLGVGSTHAVATSLPQQPLKAKGEEEAAVAVAGQEWHAETSWLELLRDTAVSLNRQSTRQLMLRPPPPESPAASRKNLHASTDLSALDALVDTLDADDAPAPQPPPRDKWVGGKVSFTANRALPAPPLGDKR